MDDAHVSELLLAKGIDDPEQVVYLAAMEGVWDRPATDAVVDGLWSRAVTAQFATYRPSVQAVPETVSFRGVAVGVQSTADNGLYERALDNGIASDVLVHLNAPQLVPKLKGLLDEVEAAYAKRNPNGDGGQGCWMYMPSQESMKNVSKIVMAYKAKELVPELYRIATGPVLQRSSGMQGRQIARFTGRIGRGRWRGFCRARGRYRGIGT